MGTKNFKSGGAYKKWLGYVYANDLNKPGGDDVTIKGKKHKVDRSTAKQTITKQTNMKTNQDGGGKSSTEAADQLKKLGSPAKSIRVKSKSSDSPAESIRVKAKSSDSPAKEVNSWEEENVERGREQQKEGHTGYADALFTDAHDSHNWHGGNYGHESWKQKFVNKSPFKQVNPNKGHYTSEKRKNMEEQEENKKKAFHTRNVTEGDGRGYRTDYAKRNAKIKSEIWHHDEKGDSARITGMHGVPYRFTDQELRDMGSLGTEELSLRAKDKGWTFGDIK